MDRKSIAKQNLSILPDEFKKLHKKGNLKNPVPHHKFHPLPLERLQPLFCDGGTHILLDTASPSGHNCLSYLFTRPLRTLCAKNYQEVAGLLKQIDVYSRDFWVCGYLSYEAGYALEPRLVPLQTAAGKSTFPLGWFGVFKKPHIFNHCTGRWNTAPAVAAGLRESADRPDAGALRLSTAMRRQEYTRAINRIRQYIAQGDIYQANFTFDMYLKTTLSPFDIYRRIRNNQPAPYCAYIAHEHGHITSFSPELFFSMRGASITVKPMKGTARRGLSSSHDKEVASALASDTKNRAENIMIVDLLRNDLGRICRNATVRTRRIFEVETHHTLHQMTSTVTGTLKKSCSFADIINAVFPSGSVTGAPKIRTMEILEKLERGNRGVYTGAIGFVSPDRSAVFNVPIRTLQKLRKETRWRFRVGGGIIWDSGAGQEWEECETKSRFITDALPRFELIETILWKNGCFAYLGEHLSRLESSAAYFGIPLDTKILRRRITGLRRRLGQARRMRVRILCDGKGNLRSEAVSPEKGWSQRPLTLVKSKKHTDANNPFLYHKTTYRPWYQAAAKAAMDGKCYDTVFTNTKNEITECAMNNIFVRLGDLLYTPPIECGCLPGVLRAALLKSGKCREKILYEKDISGADEIYCGNSVRGLVQVYPAD
jgi:para-aminobenzoate synthetase/4-amino-4-deoxychorismate lyase